MLTTGLEILFLIAIVVGVFLLWGAGVAWIAFGVLGLVFLELDEILVMIASRRPKK